MYSRSEDRSFFAAFDYYTTKYKLILWVLGLFLLALGFDFKTPKSIFKDLQGQITDNKRQVDSVVSPRISAVNDRVDLVNQKINVLLLLRCTDKAITKEQRQLSGLEAFCTDHPTGSQ